MKEHIVYKDYIDKLNANSICTYLRCHGWTEICSLKSGAIRQFEKEGVEDSILIPMSSAFSDYYKVFLESLDLLSSSEQSSLLTLLNKLTNPSCDLMKWRISDSDTFKGSIPFEAMINNIDIIRDLLSASYLDIKSPSVYHKKATTKDVERQISQYKFGQTEIGSYILNILSPLGNYQYEMFDPNVAELPMNRRINIKLLNSIDKIQKSIDEGSSELNDEVQAQRISVNFLSALSNLYAENKDASVSITADWNTDVPNIEGATVIPSVILNPRNIDKVVEIAELNTPKDEQNVPTTFFGKIIDIGGEAELTKRSNINVKIATIGNEGRKITVQAELDWLTYFEVAEYAFEYAKDVKLSGLLNKTGNTKKLSDAKIEIANQ